MYLRPIFLGIFSFLILTVGRGEMISPLKIPLLMSANFGELRPNHFHSGIDLKTQGRIGLCFSGRCFSVGIWQSCVYQSLVGFDYGLRTFGPVCAFYR